MDESYTQTEHGKKPITLRDRIITGLFKGAAFTGVMFILYHVMGRDAGILEGTLLFLISGILFGILDPIRNLSLTDFTNKKGNLGILIVMAVISQIVALALYLNMGQNHFLLFLLGSVLVTIGGVRKM